MSFRKKGFCALEEKESSANRNSGNRWRLEKPENFLSQLRRKVQMSRFQLFVIKTF